MQPDSVTMNSIHLRVPGFCTGRMRRSIYAELYERREVKAVARYVHHNDNVVEAGAGIGYLSLVIAGIVGSGRLTVVEANRILPEWIEANFRANGMVPPRILHGLVSPPGQAEIRRFNVSEEIWSSSVLNRGGTVRVEQVPCIDLDGLLTSARASVLVCDVEGAEAELIRHCDFPGLRTLIIELHPRLYSDFDAEDATAGLARRGFRLEQIVEREVYVFRRTLL